MIWKQSEDPVVKKLIEAIKAQQIVDYELRFDRALLKHGRIYVPKSLDLEQGGKILEYLTEEEKLDTEIWSWK